ncbi:putative integral membrane protein [Babesia bovis T2Bo]|uniref:Membrane protein, putative n=1 Tax=Babesia bovis TaxID=5865 RepID=A7ALZ2_BABBO|nr:putative integral membrane protein [Babesia bovis T2Bo]EDO07576.1 putative integral membrane protein [Babesia bovis T2Bo]BAN65694.1 membrane protein, putative [Babesia bovis]|eukprot:XP_001611144.1 membrane protein [Babesia bovis T2Bo]
MDSIVGLIGIFYFLGVSANSPEGDATVDTSTKGVGSKFFGNKKAMIIAGVILVLVIVVCVSIWKCSSNGSTEPAWSAGIVIGVLAIGGILCYIFRNKIRNLFTKKAAEEVVTS